MPEPGQAKLAKRDSLFRRLRRLVALPTQLDRHRSEQKKISAELKALRTRQGVLADQLRRDVQDATRKVEKRLARLDRLVTDIEKQQRVARRERRKGVEKLDSLLRHDYLAEVLADDLPVQIGGRRFNLLSQNEEDGMILALLQAVGVKTRTFVEIGSGMSGGNSGMLADEFGWRGIMVELDPRRAEKCRERFGRRGRVQCLCAYISPDNINRLIEDHGVAGEVDLFSLDIDSFDYWVLEAMTACQPRVMVLEYNANYGAEAAVTVPLGCAACRWSQGLSRCFVGGHDQAG